MIDDAYAAYLEERNRELERECRDLRNVSGSSAAERWVATAAFVLVIVVTTGVVATAVVLTTRIWSRYQQLMTEGCP